MKFSSFCRRFIFLSFFFLFQRKLLYCYFNYIFLFFFFLNSFFFFFSFCFARNRTVRNLYPRLERGLRCPVVAVQPAAARVRSPVLPFCVTSLLAARRERERKKKNNLSKLKKKNVVLSRLCPTRATPRCVWSRRSRSRAGTWTGTVRPRSPIGDRCEKPSGRPASSHRAPSGYPDYSGPPRACGRRVAFLGEPALHELVAPCSPRDASTSRCP